MSTNTPNSDFNQNQEHSDSSGKKLSLQERKDARTKLTQEINEKLEKQYNFLRNLGNKKASEITDADLAQLKKEGYIQEFDAPLARKLLEERIHLLIKIDDGKKEKTTLKNSLKRARHYNTLLKMKKNLLRILKRKTIQAHIDNFGVSNNFHAFEIEDTKHSLGRKIRTQHEEERNLAQKIAAIDNQLGPYTQVNGGLYLLSVKGKEALPEVKNIKLFTFIHNEMKKPEYKFGIYDTMDQNNIAGRILCMCGENEERAKELIKLFTFIHNEMKDEKEYPFHRDGTRDQNNIACRILGMCGGDQEKAKKSLKLFTFIHNEMKKKEEYSFNQDGTRDKNSIAGRILGMCNGSEANAKELLRFFCFMHSEMQKNDEYPLHGAGTKEKNTIAGMILGMCRGDQEKAKKLLSDFSFILGEIQKQGYKFSASGAMNRNNIAGRILALCNGDKEKAKELIGIFSFIYEETQKNEYQISTYNAMDRNNIAGRILALCNGGKEKAKELIGEFSSIRSEMKKPEYKFSVGGNMDQNNITGTILELVNRGTFSHHDLNETMNQFSSSYKSYLSENNLAEDAMTFNMFIDLLVDGKLDMPFMRGGDMTTGIMMDLMMNFDHDHSFLDSVFDHQGLDSVMGDSMHDISDTLGADSLTHDFDSLHTDTNFDISSNDYDSGSSFDSTDYSSSGSEY